MTFRARAATLALPTFCDLQQKFFGLEDFGGKGLGGGIFIGGELPLRRKSERDWL